MIQSGVQVGRLLVLEQTGWRHFPSKLERMWKCLCVCGKETRVQNSNLNSKRTRSCGCLEKENLDRLVRKLVKHGDSKRGNLHHLYTVWGSMKQRCEDPDHPRFEDWGGRGIKILWKCYEDFKRDMEPTYRPGLQIERKNNSGHYCKENCTWATPKEQSNNRRPRRWHRRPRGLE